MEVERGRWRRKEEEKGRERKNNCKEKIGCKVSRYGLLYGLFREGHSEELKFE